jgi:hypothetical protein
MRRREPIRLNGKDTVLGILVEMAFTVGLILLAAVITLLVGWGVR